MSKYIHAEVTFDIPLGDWSEDLKGAQIAIDELGEVTRDVREHFGLSRTQVEQAIGITQSRIGTIETGQNRPSIDEALKLVGFLQSLIDGATPEPVNPPEFQSVPVTTSVVA